MLPTPSCCTWRPPCCYGGGQSGPTRQTCPRPAVQGYPGALHLENKNFYPTRRSKRPPRCRTHHTTRYNWQILANNCHLLQNCSWSILGVQCYQCYQFTQFKQCEQCKQFLTIYLNLWWYFYSRHFAVNKDERYINILQWKERKRWRKTCDLLFGESFDWEKKFYIGL